jgi:hypothetical protein
MNKQFVPVVAALALLQGTPAGAAGGPYDDAVPLRVVDAQGTVVGRWDGGSVDIAVNGVLAQLPLSSGNSSMNLRWLSGGYPSPLLFYPSRDCSGTGYAQLATLHPQGTYPAGLTSGKGGVLLYLADSSIPGNFEFHAHSQLYTNGKCKTPAVRDVQAQWRLSAAPVDLGYLQLPFTLQ